MEDLTLGGIFNIFNPNFKGIKSFNNHFLKSEDNLLKYMTFYCQNLWPLGQTRQKKDICHTCYALSGLRASQGFRAFLNGEKLSKFNHIYNKHNKRLFPNSQRLFFITCTPTILCIYYDIKNMMDEY